MIVRLRSDHDPEIRLDVQHSAAMSPTTARWVGLLMIGSWLVVEPASAWGPTGHRAVAAIAAELLSDRARAEVEALLGGRSLVEVSTWADDVRGQPGFEWIAPLHYVNFDPRVGRFEGCPSGGCVIGAIEDAVSTLGSDSGSRAERELALKLLIHLVGDLHQPLHVSHAGDRGGNLIEVHFLGEETNLHRVWDGGILYASDLTWRELAVRQLTTLAVGAKSRLAAWRRGSFREWAQESYRLAVTVVYPTAPAGARLDGSYAAVFLPLVEERIAAAGVRLAWTLEAIFS